MKSALEKRLNELGREHIVHQVKRIASSRRHHQHTTRKKWLRSIGENVLFIQGYLGCLYTFIPLGDALMNKGYRVHYLDIPTFQTTKPVKGLAEMFARYVLDNDIRSLSIVGHSKGGIIAKYLLKHYPEVRSRVKKVITVATPHRGAKWTRLPLPGARELSPRSTLLAELSGKEIEQKIVAICNTSDLMVRTENEKTEHGINHVVDVWGHKNIMFHPEMIECVLRVLAK